MDEDRSVCPCCGKVTECTDRETYSDPNMWYECEHCDCEYQPYNHSFASEDDKDLDHDS